MRRCCPALLGSAACALSFGVPAHASPTTTAPAEEHGTPAPAHPEPKGIAWELTALGGFAAPVALGHEFGTGPSLAIAGLVRASSLWSAGIKGGLTSLPWTIDVPGHQVTRDGTAINLTPLEFDLLVCLARRPHQVFSREVLLEQVWGYRHAADTRLVNVHVQRLRSKVEHDPENPEIVVTVRGVGYKAGPQ